MPKKSKSSSKSKSKSKSSSNSLFKSNSSSSSRSSMTPETLKKITVLQKKLSFLKILLNDNKEYLNHHICRQISEEIDASMKKYNAAAGIIQSRFRTKQYEKGMIENGYFKLACGNWSDGAQCMCDICYGI